MSKPRLIGDAFEEIFSRPFESFIAKRGSLPFNPEASTILSVGVYYFFRLLLLPTLLMKFAL